MLSILVLPWVSGCGLGEDYPIVNYRLTIDVDTPEGVRSGSGIVSVSVSRSVFPQSAIQTTLIGQGAMVDLGARGRLFSLMTAASGGDWSSGFLFSLRRMFPEHHSNGNMTPELWQAISTFRRPVIIPRRRRMRREWVDTYPRLATIVEEDGKRVPKLVDPDDMPASFGEGVRIRRMFGQIVDDPPVVTNDQYLPDVIPAPYPMELQVPFGGTRYQEMKMYNGDFYRKGGI